MTEKPAAVWGVRRGARELADGTVRVQIDIDPKNRKAFFDLFSEIDMPVAIAPLNPGVVSTAQEGRDEDHESGRAERSLAQRLHIEGYFRNPSLWRAMHAKGLYTLQEHKAWVERQGCIAHHVSMCHGDVVLHHCANSHTAAAGSRLQPEAPNKVPHWYGVPLCNGHHRDWAHGGASRGEKEQLLVAAIQLMSNQAKEVMKQRLGLESLSGLTQEMFDAFEEELGA